MVTVFLDAPMIWKLLRFGMTFLTMYTVHHLLPPPETQILPACKSLSVIAFPITLHLL